MPKSTRQIRLDPDTEDAVQKVAESESRSFSGTCNWLLKRAAEQYLAEHGLKSE